MFQFNETDSFAVNLASFVTHMESVDADMAKILKENLDKLTTLVRDGNRNTVARQEFNAAVNVALNNMISPTTNSLGE